MKHGIYYSNQDSHHTFKLVGEFRFNQSDPLFDMIEKFERIEDLKSLKVDLSEATLLDSTILGTIAELGLLFIRKGRVKPLIVCQNKGIQRTLEAIGLHQVFTLSESPIDECNYLLLGDHTSDDIKSKVIQAHEQLMSLSKKNRQAFTEVVQTLKKKGDDAHD